MKKKVNKRMPTPKQNPSLRLCFFLICIISVVEDTADTIDIFLTKILHKQTTNKDVGMGL